MMKSGCIPIQLKVSNETATSTKVLLAGPKLLPEIVKNVPAAGPEIGWRYEIDGSV
jgi:hypothetical protein